MKNHYGTDERIHMAQLVIVPASNASWGYGLYVHPGVPANVVKKAISQFTALKVATPILLKTLDLGAKFEFATLDDATVQAMRKLLVIDP